MCRTVSTTLLVLALVGAPALADPINPTPSATELCPDGTPRSEWVYDSNGGIPDNATPIECDNPDGCYGFPKSGCLSLSEVSKPPDRYHLPPIKGKPPEEPGNQPEPPKMPPLPNDHQPTHPTGSVEPLPAPGEDGCVEGTGWDFEKVLEDKDHPGAVFADLQGWVGGDVEGVSPWVDFQGHGFDWKAAPVYGNAAPIDRIHPPGWSPAIATQIGGDYWKYSQPVNAQGSFWLSSLYRRYSWKQHPGDSWGARAYGYIASPGCVLRAGFVSFRLSGARSPAQRVELQVLGGRTADYFGIRFPGGPGDSSLGDKFGHGTQFPAVPAAAPSYPPLPKNGWVTVRSVTSEDYSESDWMQTYVFDLRDFFDHKVRLVVIDDHREDCAAYYLGTCIKQAQEHINVDDFRYADNPPEGTEWLTFDERRPRSPIGIVRSQPPLWGMTDAHAHPMANLGFGGHVVWGDVADTLEDVYDCSRSLPAIAGPGGRPAMNDPAHTTACYVSGDIVAFTTGVLLGGCSALAVVPVIGWGAAAVCTGIVSGAAAALVTTPVIEGLTLHDARKFASGAFKLGLILSKSWESFVQIAGVFTGDVGLAFEEGLLPTIDGTSNAAPTLDWYDRDVNWHSFTGLGKTHNLYQADMIRRAYQGGMRLGVWDVVNSRALALVTDGDTTASDWKALKDQTDAAKRIVATVLSDIATIAYTPEEAEHIIGSGRMAVILGSEVDELGRMRPDNLPWPRSPHEPGDSMRKQIDDLWELGIRKVSPVHAVNNPVGGPAIFTAQYAANNHYLNGSPIEGEPSFTDLAPVRFVLERSPWMPIALLLGQASLIRAAGGDGVQPWNPAGWFSFDPSATTSNAVIGPEYPVTWRLGQEEADTLRGLDRKWLPPSEVLGKQVLIAQTIASLSTFIRSVGRCDLFNTFKPDYAQGFGDEVNKQFVSVDGHRNALGIYHDGSGNDGEAFLRAAMKKGMMIDLDHMSQNMRGEVYQLGADWGAEAGTTQHYPFMGVHTTVRELEKEGSNIDTIKNSFGANDESTRTPKELAWVADHGGLVGVFPRGSAFIPPNTTDGRCSRDSDCASNGCIEGRCSAQAAPLDKRDLELPSEVANDCDSSSKTFAVKYLWLMKQMKGRGLTFTSDLNGLIGTIAPRFGRAIKVACSGGKRAVIDGLWAGREVGSQKNEHSGVWYSDYTLAVDSDLASGWTDPQPYPHKRWRQYVARKAGAIREDNAPRFAVDELVYFNDHGPDLEWRNWFDQSGNRPGAQMYPVKRWQRGHSGWDFNLDGMQHIGLLPDLIQDMRNVGVQWEQLGPLFRGANDFIDTWRRSVQLGLVHP